MTEYINNDDILTTRQKQCLFMVAKGFTIQSIAQGLSITERTVQKHLKNARINLNANSTAQAIYIAFSQNLIK